MCMNFCNLCLQYSSHLGQKHSISRKGKAMVWWDLGLGRDVFCKVAVVGWCVLYNTYYWPALWCNKKTFCPYFFFLFQLFCLKNIEKVNFDQCLEWSAQHPNAGQNIQHKLSVFLPSYHPKWFNVTLGVFFDDSFSGFFNLKKNFGARMILRIGRLTRNNLKSEQVGKQLNLLMGGGYPLSMMISVWFCLVKDHLVWRFTRKKIDNFLTSFLRNSWDNNKTLHDDEDEKERKKERKKERSKERSKR